MLAVTKAVVPLPSPLSTKTATMTKKTMTMKRNVRAGCQKTYLPIAHLYVQTSAVAAAAAVTPEGARDHDVRYDLDDFADSLIAVGS